jgi:hypothetical protein
VVGDPNEDGTILEAPVFKVTASLRGVSFWGWHVSLDVSDETATTLGSGTGLGRRGQILKRGYCLNGGGGAVLFSVVPTKHGGSSVVENGAEVGQIARVRHGIGGVAKPHFVLSYLGSVLGEAATDTHWATTWTVTDAAGVVVADIRTLPKEVFARSGSCRTTLHQPLPVAFRKMLLAATADFAIFRMKYNTRPKHR